VRRQTRHGAQGPRCRGEKERALAVRERRRPLGWSRSASFARGSRFPVVWLSGAAPVPNVGRSSHAK